MYYLEYSNIQHQSQPVLFTFRRERGKKVPTFKDLDFMEMYPEGILLQVSIYYLNSISTLLNWGLDTRTCLVFKWSIFVQLSPPSLDHFLHKFFLDNSYVIVFVSSQQKGAKEQ